MVGKEPAGIELEIAFRLGSDVPAGATPAQVLDAVAAAHVVFELCQSPHRRARGKQPRHVMLADCIANAGLVVGPEIAVGAARTSRRARAACWSTARCTSRARASIRSAPCRCCRRRWPRAASALAAGQIVITGSLIGMNWLTGRHALKGIIDGCGEVAIELAAA